MQVNSELREAQIENKSSDYTHNNQRKGLLWFNTATDKMKALYNSTVEILATESWVSARIDDSETGLKETGLVTDEQSEDQGAQEVGERLIYAKDDGIYEVGEDGNNYQLLRKEEYFDQVNLINLNVDRSDLTFTEIKPTGSPTDWYDEYFYELYECFGDKEIEIKLDKYLLVTNEGEYLNTRSGVAFVENGVSLVKRVGGEPDVISPLSNVTFLPEARTDNLPSGGSRNTDKEVFLYGYTARYKLSDGDKIMVRLQDAWKRSNKRLILNGSIREVSL